MMPYGSASFGSGFMWVGFLFMLLFWALIILGIVALVTWVGKQARPHPPMETPVDILNKRYARGEVSQEEYERVKKTLTG